MLKSSDTCLLFATFLIRTLLFRVLIPCHSYFALLCNNFYLCILVVVLICDLAVDENYSAIIHHLPLVPKSPPPKGFRLWLFLPPRLGPVNSDCPVCIIDTCGGH